MEMATVAKTEGRAFALRALLEHLAHDALVVASNSCVAAALGVELSNRAMSSAVYVAVKKGWVVRYRDIEVRDHFENQVTFRITQAGRAELASLTT